ncbi:MAG TPA: alpha/beta hydrolase-fold protein [Candidatus Acidoferrales bacterium]|nr:alpha/beta hydrolase-fold protein [Candidatus Acidoferrales bacterium]
MKLRHAIFEPEGEGPHPTILALHGWGANALDLLGLAPHLCGGRFLVICPQGTIAVPVGPELVGYGWFPLRLGGPPDIPAIVEARESVEAFFDQCVKRYPIDANKVVVLGFSQGGALSYVLGLNRPERFAAVVAISTWLPEELVRREFFMERRAKPAVLVQHGSRDELVDVDRARESVEKLRELKLPVTYREYDIGHEISPRSLGELSVWLEEKVLE